MLVVGCCLASPLHNLSTARIEKQCLGPIGPNRFPWPCRLLAAAPLPRRLRALQQPLPLSLAWQLLTHS